MTWFSKTDDPQCIKLLKFLFLIFIIWAAFCDKYRKKQALRGSATASFLAYASERLAQDYLAQAAPPILAAR